MTDFKEIDERIKKLALFMEKHGIVNLVEKEDIFHAPTEITILKEWRTDKLETIEKIKDWFNHIHALTQGLSDLNGQVAILVNEDRLASLLKQLSGTEDKT